MMDSNINYVPTSSEVRFFSLLDNFEWLSKFWDKKRKSCNIDALTSQLGVMSHGENLLAQFFLAIWKGDGKDFDILEAGAILGTSEIEVIVFWLKDPFWP